MGKNRTKYHVSKRVFLNRETELPAYIIGIVQDTSELREENDWKYGTIILKMGDCYRGVAFDFSTDTPEERTNSLYKINRIAEVVNAVRDAIEKEVESLNERSAKRAKQKKSEE
ncbi:MAG TPA: hypothetical protein VEX64_00805 [Pyrinomonadaceae bacterium]|nr:hypothetical protein [Pyrinomonadaceae bacterium]